MGRESAKDVSPEPIFRQMARLERSRDEVLNELAAAKAAGQRSPELSAELRDYLAFTTALNEQLQQTGTEDLRAKVIQRLVHKIEIQPNSHAGMPAPLPT